MYSLFSEVGEYSEREVHFHGIFTSYDKAIHVFQTLIQKELHDIFVQSRSTTPWNKPYWTSRCSSYFLYECEIDEQIIHSNLLSPDLYNESTNYKYDKYIVLNPNYYKPEYAHIYAKEDFINDEEYLALMPPCPYAYVLK